MAVIGLGKALIFLKAKIIGVNLALAANPYVLLAMGIGAATVAIYRAVTAHQRFRQEVLTGTKTVGEAQEKYDKLKNKIKEMNEELNGIKGGGRSKVGRRNRLKKDIEAATTETVELKKVIKEVTEKVDTELNVGFSNTVKISEQVGQAVRSGIVDAIEGAITGAQSLGDVLSGVLKQIGRMYLTAGVNAIPFPGLGERAEGGFITKPEVSLIGEGGEPEYVIPDSKMDSAMARYSQGARGDAVLAGGGGDDAEGVASGGGGGNINVTFASEVINDVSYVTYAQFEAGVQQAAVEGARRGEQATLRRLQTSPSTRRRVGV